MVKGGGGGGVRVVEGQNASFQKQDFITLHHIPNQMLFTEIENHFLFLRYLHLKLQKHKGFYRKVQLQIKWFSEIAFEVELFYKNPYVSATSNVNILKTKNDFRFL